MAKVVSILQDTTITTTDDDGGITDQSAAACDFTTFQHPNINVSIEYLPCVATFGSYKDGSGSTVRYMEKIEYHGPQGTQLRGSSLAPFFDDVGGEGNDTNSSNNNNHDLPQLNGIAAIAIGCGIESPEDIAMIQSFVAAISGAGSSPAQSGGEAVASGDGGDDKAAEDDDPDNTEKSGPVIRCIEPNADFSSMKEETEAYKAMGADEKAEVTRLGTIGPGKMAKFAYTLAAEVIQDAITVAFPQKEADAEEEVEPDIPEPEPIVERVRDPSKIQYACRMCRTVLFDEDDLEDPPHSKASHSFSRRKHDKSAGRSGSASQCESKFLSEALDWMGDTSAFEGKLHCPKCDFKVGNWNWSGAQCSCGTWVTPAVQIPNGKVDELNAAKTAQAAAAPVSSSITAGVGSISIAGLPVVQPQIPRSIN